MPPKSATTVRQRRIARKLRAWRIDRGRTLDQVGSQLRWSESKLSRIERAESGVGPAEIIALATILGVDDAERDRLVQIARVSSTGHDLWGPYGPESLRGEFKDFVEDEAEAVQVRTVESTLITGLLQTAEYAEALVRAWDPGAAEEVLAQRRQLRQQRQARLDAPEPLKLHTILYEPTMTVPIGGNAVMRRQLEHLVERSEAPNITIQLLPLSVGAFPGIGASYHLIDFTEGCAGAAYVEALQDGTYYEDEDELSAYTLAFDHVRKLALDPAESVRRISEIGESLA
ncbi:helix-turn-helix domain-containing protein [Actinokineospora soli]|uniref:Helix-turn-helix domain-containing protein n=1 Tax=Actinokineospora soli TaxID=1048753 RepID=A0ABW2TLR3_9PSEU